MKTYKWNGPGALSSGGTTVKQDGEIPSEIVEKLEAKREGKTTTMLDDYIKLKSISPVASEEPAPVVEKPAPVEKTLAELTDEEITALSLDELSSKRFSKDDLKAKAESVGHETVAGDNKPDFAQAIFDHFNQA